MNDIRLDPERLAALRTTQQREKAGLNSAESALRTDMASLAELRREITVLKRQVDRAGGENLEKRLAALKEREAQMLDRVSTAEETVNVARDRHAASLQTLKACSDFLASIGAE